MTTPLTAVQIQAQARQRRRARREVAEQTAQATTFRGAAKHLQELRFLPDDAPRPHELLISGPSECLAGETPIYDPLTGQSTPIAELCAAGKPITVLTVEGPRQATAPFRKGIAPLYRVTMESGRSFLATARHRLLTTQGWMFVCALRAGQVVPSSAPSLPASSSGACLPASQQDARHSSQTIPDSQARYSACCRPCDAPLRRAQDSARSFAPSLNGARAHSYDDRGAGDRNVLPKHSHPDQLPARPSIWRCVRPLPGSWCTEYCSSLDTPLHGACLLQYGEQWPLYRSPLPPSSGSMPHCAKLPSDAYTIPINNDTVLPNTVYDHYTTQSDVIVSICYERIDFYYDMHVPGAEHYFAGGLWHHNTGKTVACLTFLDACMRAYPGAQATICRKVRADMDSSVLRTWRRIIDPLGGVHDPYGGEKPVFYQYENGSRVWVAGLDKPGSALSSERDLVYVNQAEELNLDDWQTLTTRTTGRGSVMPWTMLYGDCNPGPPTHWIVDRESLTRWESRHEDNPSLFDDDGQIIAQGVRTMAVLDALVGVLKERLRYGRWVAAEGTVYQLDRALHMIDRMPTGWEQWRKVRAFDFGYTNPFVCLWGAVDGDGRIYIYRQLYMTGRTVEEHAKQIQRLERWFLPDGSPNPEREKISMSVADHDAEDRATLQAHRIITIPAQKGISTGIQAVQKRLQKAGDGRVRLRILEGSLVERDETLAAKHHPVCLEQELDVYAWPKAADGKPIKEVPIDLFNHGCDSLMYLVRAIDKIGTPLVR